MKKVSIEVTSGLVDIGFNKDHNVEVTLGNTALLMALEDAGKVGFDSSVTSDYDYEEGLREAYYLGKLAERIAAHIEHLKEHNGITDNEIIEFKDIYKLLENK